MVDIIRARAQIQFYPGQIANNVLKHAVYVAGKYGFLARQPLNRTKAFKFVHSLKMLKNGTLRYTHPAYLQLYMQFIRQNKEVTDLNLVEYILLHRGCSKQDLTRHFNIPASKIRMRLQKEQGNGFIIIDGDQIWHFTEYLKKYPQIPYPISSDQIVLCSVAELQQSLILYVLERYPYLSIKQLHSLTAISLYDLSIQLAHLSRSNRIQRGISVEESPNEYFMINSMNLDDSTNWNHIGAIVLEKRDAFVELLELEWEFSPAKSNYWILIKGIPEAEFNLSRHESSMMITHFRTLPTTSLSTVDIFAAIKDWAKRMKIQIVNDNLDDNNSQLAKLFTKLLNERGYSLFNSHLVLRTNKVTNSSAGHSSKLFSWSVVGLWYREKQYLTQPALSAEELLKRLIQIDDIISLSIRLIDLKLENTTLTYGINFRKGYISPLYLPDIFTIWKKEANLSILDKKILHILENKGISESELVKQLSINAFELKKRLSYLLSHRKITLINGVYHALNISLKPSVSKNILFINLLENFLQVHPPLTINQISRFFGITETDIKKMLQTPLRSGRLIEGYFLDSVNLPQISSPTVLDELSNYLLPEDDLESYERVDILSDRDPISILFLQPLLISSRELQITHRLAPNTIIRSITWDGIIIGYSLFIPNAEARADYVIDIRILKEYQNNLVLAGIVQKIVNQNMAFDNDVLKLNSINHIPVDDEIFEPLQFLFATLNLV